MFLNYYFPVFVLRISSRFSYRLYISHLYHFIALKINLNHFHIYLIYIYIYTKIDLEKPINFQSTTQQNRTQIFRYHLNNNYKIPERRKNEKDMSYFYSEEMTYCQCIMPRQIGWEVVDELGQMECVHFENKSIQYDSPYLKNMKRCEQAISRVNQIKAFVLTIKPDFKLKPPLPYKKLLSEYQRQIRSKKIHGHLMMNEIQDEILNIHTYLTQQKKQLDHLNNDLNSHLLDASLIVTLSSSEDFKSISTQKRQASYLQNSELTFDFKSIIINRKDEYLLQKGLFRISRGNAWVKCIQINQANLYKMFHKQFQFLKDKVVCIIMHQTGQSKILQTKINRFLACVQCTSMNISADRWQRALNSMQQKIKQLNNLINLTNDAVERYLHKMYEPRGNSQFSYLTFLESYAHKQYEIYRQLCCTYASKSFLHFNLYIPTKNLPLNIHPNDKLPPLTLTPKKSTKSPPTKFDTPSIMEIPQQILNTYGVPTYGQFNPAVFYIITFGFFIGVMFGDVGHMLMAVPFVIYFKVNKWAWTVLFFMGYCGLIYNQFFGLNLGLFQSCYEFPDIEEYDIQDLNTTNDDNEGSNTTIPLSNLTQFYATVVKIDQQCVYPLGVDSIWKPAQNQMQFTNSLKMKIAVIIGVVHMMLGLFVKLANGIKRRHYLEIFTLTVPQIVFMSVTFVYMDYLILLKWGMDFSGQKSAEAPSIIATMIAVFAGFGGDSLPVFWERQRAFQRFLVAMAAISIPIMLLGVPLGTFIKRRRRTDRTHIMGSEQNQFQEVVEEKYLETDPEQVRSQEMLMQIKKGVSGSQKDIEEQQPIREIFVHQFIETIQYVLGAVSNTASYLRLWALSLAHGQLSQVIFDLVLKSTVSGGYPSIVPVMLVFPFYYMITFGVLICMDAMECFLHSLRLHWVEFQNKFYKGTGYKFQEFNFKNVIKPILKQ